MSPLDLQTFLGQARRADRRWHRWRHPDRRRILLDARTAMNFAMMAPIYRVMRRDRRVEFFATSSEQPGNIGEIFKEANGGIRPVTPSRAGLMRFDAYLAADFLWTPLPRGTSRIQMFHGVAGKFGNEYEKPEMSMRAWHRLFFINRRRMANYIASGAIDPESPAARLVGMPKVDCLVDGSLERNTVLSALGIDPTRRTVLYAPTWSAYSSLTTIGEDLVRALGAAGFVVILKLHDRSRDPRYEHSGGVDWGARLEPILRTMGGVLATGSDSSPYLVAADALVTDHSSIGFEYLLLDRPLVRIDTPALISATNVDPGYVNLMGRVAATVRTVKDAVSAVEHSLTQVSERSATRKEVAEELFHQPGTATERAVRELYEVLELGVDRCADPVTP